MTKKQQIFTIPNLLSFFRLLLIPVIVWLYCDRHAYGWTLSVLILSGLTDIADGYIARRWNLISDFGKALDPVADKLTQIATLWCLVSRFSYMWLPLGILLIKELFTGIMSLYAVKKSGQVKGADWHGKLCTATVCNLTLQTLGKILVLQEHRVNLKDLCFLLPHVCKRAAVQF